MKQKPTFLLVVGVLSTVAAFAGKSARAQQMNAKDSPCAGVVVTTDLVDCLVKAKDLSDKRLNSLYRDIRKRLDANDVERLTRVERLWIQYREANCSAERELYEGGTASWPAYLACLEAMTRERIRELEVTYAVKLK